MFESVSVDGVSGRFTCQVAGPEDGPLLLAIHDEVQVAPSPVVEHLAKSHRVYAPVLPGFGAADRPDWVESMVDLVDHLAELTDRLEREPAVLVGASLGGWVAAEVALRLAPRPVRTVLLGPAGLQHPERPVEDHWFAEPEERQAMLYLDAACAPSVELDEYLANEESTARYAWSPRFASRTLAHRLPRLTGPTLVCWGAEDRFMDPAHLELWESALPEVSVARIEASGHFPAYEQPERTTEVIEGWLA